MQYLRDIVGLAALGWPLTLLVAIAIFFAVSIVVAVQVSKRTQRKRLWRWGIVLAAYLLIFWNHIPTILVHEYYCEKEAGFWVYKTLDQWKAENPGVMETLVANKGEPFRHESFDDRHGKMDTYLVNDRFNWIVTQQDISGLLPIIRTERQIRDIQKNEILARYVDFGTGNSVKHTAGPSGSLKFWLRDQYCRNGEDRAISSAKFLKQFKGAEQ
jgi:hypothetical protein